MTAIDVVSITKFSPIDEVIEVVPPVTSPVDYWLSTTRVANSKASSSLPPTLYKEAATKDTKYGSTVLASIYSVTCTTKASSSIYKSVTPALVKAQTM